MRIDDQLNQLVTQSARLVGVNGALHPEKVQRIAEALGQTMLPAAVHLRQATVAVCTNAALAQLLGTDALSAQTIPLVLRGHINMMAWLNFEQHFSGTNEAPFQQPLCLYRGQMVTSMVMWSVRCIGRAQGATVLLSVLVPLVPDPDLKPPGAPNNELEALIKRLGPRELEVLDLLAHDQSISAVAARLNLSVNTVATHKKNIMRKLNVTSAFSLLGLMGFDLGQH